MHTFGKPENLLFNEAEYKWQICDFGLARETVMEQNTSSTISLRDVILKLQKLILQSEASPLISRKTRT